MGSILGRFKPNKTIQVSICCSPLRTSLKRCKKLQRLSDSKSAVRVDRYAYLWTVRCVSVLVLYKTDSTSSHSKIMCFRYDILGGKITPLALNNNHPITFAIDVYYCQIWEFEFCSWRDVYENVCQWLVAREWFSLNTLVSI